MLARKLARAHRATASIDAGIIGINTSGLKAVKITADRTKPSCCERDKGRAALEPSARSKSASVAFTPQGFPIGGAAP